MKKKSEFSSKKITKLKQKESTQTSEVKENNTFFGNQEIKQHLQSFYDTEAQKYAETRKKFWHEEKIILETITPLFSSHHFDEINESTEFIKNKSQIDFSDKYWNDRVYEQDNQKKFIKKIRILEFWCGSGRFATLLNQNFPNEFDYVGIDLSGNLLSYASKDNPNLTFFQWDITKLVKNFEQESFDLIVWTSSFQHIPTTKERSFLMKNFYRLLDYDWILLMTNWSLSKWFTQKHWKSVLKSRILSRFHFDNNKSRDLIVPWTDAEWKVFERFYHFFSLKELENLAKFSWLNSKIITFIDQDGNFINDEKLSRSSFFVATKNPIIN